MSLYENKKLSKTMVLLDEHKKQMPAVLVFASAIKYLKEHVFAVLTKRISDIGEDDIDYVLTVPAIWNENAKHFMRQAATEAGIVSERLILTLEPEAASIFCSQLPVDRLSISTNCDVLAFKRGSTYMVLDLGGGTVDITVHTINSDGTIKERTRASGGAWGGTQVDAAFLNFLEEIVGKDFLDKFRKCETADFFDIMRDFEIKKRSVTERSTGFITTRMPASLNEKLKLEQRKNLQQKIDASIYTKNVFVKRDKIQIDVELVKQFIKGAIKRTIDHVLKILAENKLDKIDTILLVGGFAESDIVQDNIKTSFSNKRIIIPSDSGIAVLNGAVLFAHDPKIIRSRVSRYTYCAEVIPHQYAGTDLENDLSKHILQIFVSIGDSIPVNSVVELKNFKSTVYSVTEGVGIYTSTNKYPKHVLDPDCFKIGIIKLNEPDHTLDVEAKFGGTELLVTITDVISGVKRSGTFIFTCL